MHRNRKIKILFMIYPEQDFPISRCPELLTGKNSVNPWISPRISASNQVMIMSILIL